MFDSRVGGPDAAATLSLVTEAHRLVLAQECRLVELAAHWADLHHPDSQPPAEKRLPGAEQGRRLGGEGTPEVLEFAPAEFGAHMETSSGAARSLIADSLDLRHRHPELWQLILTGGIPAWKARKAAQATRHLTRSAAMHVDAAVARAITGLPWARFETLLAAKIIEADPHAAEQQAKIWEAERYVRAGRANRDGLKVLIAKANAGDVIWFMATINRIAEILRLQGDLDTADVRRSKAIGILAQPAVALHMLWEFRNQQHPNTDQPQRSDEPIHNEPKAPFDTSPTAPSADQDPQNLEPAPNSATPADRCHSQAGDRPAGANAAAAAESAAKPDSAGLGLIIQPTGVDIRKLRPQVILHIHLSEEALTSYQCDTSRYGGGGARFEGVGPATLGQVRRFLTDTGCDIKFQPVIDPQNNTPVDSYEIPRRIREAMFLRMLASCFPYATATGRLELDHTIAYTPQAKGGPPGQTGTHGLGPFIRFEHRIKTHGRWQVRQPEPGVWIWRSPHHSHYLVTNTGTHTLGNTTFARRLWRAAAPTRQRDPTPT
jgi:hypothetical protein